MNKSIGSKVINLFNKVRNFLLADAIYEPPELFRHEIEAIRYCNCYANLSGANWHASGCRIWEHKL